MRSLFFAVAAALSATAAPTIDVLFSQHELTAVYESAGVSSKGFIAAATWLNEPEVAEIFTLQGNKSVKSVGDSTPADESMFHISMATASTEAIVSRTMPNEFYADIFLFDAASKGVGPSWNLTLPNSEVLGVSISADGSTAAVAAYGLGPRVRVVVLDAQTGEEKPEYRWDLPATVTSIQLSLSATGEYVGVLSGNPSGLRVDVLHSSGRHSGNITNATFDSTVGQAFAISSDGRYVAAGQAYDLVVWQRTADAPPAYSTLMTVHRDANFVSAGTAAFSPDSPHLSVAWQGLNNTISQNIVQLYELPTQAPVLDVTLPPQTGPLVNWPVQTGVSSGGKYVVYCSWGAQGKQSGGAQLQVFAASGGPPAELYTPGSMMACGVAQTADGRVVAAAAGKHVHATVMGNGGDMYAVEIKSA